MKIGKYISELLFENDFVILPEIGEFSTKYIPAKFVPELKKVESPSKVIAFNAANKSGGGLLTEYIAKQEDITSLKAKEFVSTFVSEMQNSLKSGKKVELEKVGVFSMNEAGSIVFEPDTSINYLSDSMGMTSVKEPAKKSEEEAKTELDKVMEEANAGIPVKEQKPEPVEEKKPFEPASKVEQAPAVPVQKSAEPRRGAASIPASEPRAKEGLPPALKWVALTVVPLLIIIIILALNYEYIFGSKSVFFEREKATPERVVEAREPLAEPAEEAPLAAREEVVVEEAPFDPTVAPPAPERGRPVFYIIVGSFEEEHSALILAEDLRSKGARTASVFPLNRQGFYRVSYGYYYDLQEAERELARAKEVNDNAWILHR